MANDIQQWWIDTYEQNVLHALQQKESILSPCVSTGSMAGEKRRFNYLGSVEMTEIVGRNGDTDWSDPEFFNRWVSAREFAYSFLVDKNDPEKAFTDPTSDIVKAAVMAGRRRKDISIIEAFNAIAITGKQADIPVTFPSSQILDIQLGSPSGAPVNTGMNLAKLKEAKYLLDRSEIDEDEPRFFAITAFQLKELLDTTELTNKDYSDVKALQEGKINTFLGFTFKRIERLPWQNQIRSCFAWTKESVKVAVSREISTEAAKIPTKNFNIGGQVSMKLGAVRLFDKGVVEIPAAEVR